MWIPSVSDRLSVSWGILMDACIKWPLLSVLTIQFPVFISGDCSFSNLQKNNLKSLIKAHSKALNLDLLNQRI